MMRRTPQIMRNYLAKCEEINVELTQDPYDSCMLSSVKFSIRWVAPPPKHLRICSSSASSVEVFISDDYRVCPQQRSPIVIVLQNFFLLHLGERDRTRPSVLTYPFCLSHMRSSRNHIFLSLRPFAFILSLCPQVPKIEDHLLRSSSICCDFHARHSYPLRIPPVKGNFVHKSRNGLSFYPSINTSPHGHFPPASVLLSRRRS